MEDFKPYQDVVLLHDMLEEDLYAGDVGTVVERHDVPGRETGYYERIVFPPEVLEAYLEEPPLA